MAHGCIRDLWQWHAVAGGWALYAAGCWSGRGIAPAHGYSGQVVPCALCGRYRASVRGGHPGRCIAGLAAAKRWLERNATSTARRRARARDGAS